MPRAPWVSDAVYAAGGRFVHECLRSDGSLFTPGRTIWSPGNLDDFHLRFVVQEKTEGGSFIERLEEQLEGASDETIQLTAESLFVNYLCEDDTRAATKRQGIAQILGWMASPVAIPDELDEAFASGLAAVGVARAQRWQQARFLLEFTRTWKELEEGRRDDLLTNVWEFREFVHSLPKHSASIQIEGLLHLVFPEPFESIVSPNSKRDIVHTFLAIPGVDTRENVDRNIQVIRQALAPIIGEEFGFYDPSVAPIWRENAGPWRDFVGWAARLYETPGFDSTERDFKLEVAANVARAREAVLNDDPEWPIRIREAFRSRPNNLTSWRDHEPFHRWCEESPDDAGPALRKFWTADDPMSAQDALIEALPVGLIEADGGKVAVTAFLLLAVDPSRFPPFRPDPVHRAYRLLGRSTQGVSGSERYAVFLSFLDELRVRLLTRGVETRDRLDAQGLAWWITSSGPPDAWSDETKRAFLAHQAGERATRTKPTRAWLVRGEKAYGTNIIPRWLAEGFVSVGAAEEGEMRPGITRAEIVEHLRERSGGEASQHGPQADAGNRFINLMSPDDLVFTVDGDSVYFALVTGELEWDDGAEPGTARRRSADWLNPDRPVSREDLPERAKRLMRPPTVIDMTAAGPELARLAGVEWGDEDTDSSAERDGEAAIPAATVELGARLFVSTSWLQEAIGLLNEKGQVIFYGPPGTGKTYIAQELGRHVEQAGGTWRLVQFHPAYSYEDFFEGYRPLQNEEGGPLQFRLRPGPLREMVEVASERRDVPHLLVIDEINRGNLPKIFGELYFLLEYRRRAVRLQYSPEDEFSLPENLYFIGTMNTADRSIALVDSALRRRFYFVPFLPQEEPISGVLGSWLAAKGFSDEPAHLLEELNDALAERGGGADEFAIGPSYFITKDGEPDVERVWSHAILPLLEERFYGALARDQVASEFGLGAIRARLERREAPEAEPEAEAEVDPGTLIGDD
jgi:hypothetical protein